MEENIYNSSLQIMLSKFDEQPWGFRITGGADFGTPVTIIKVYGGSIAEQAGLQVDDILLGINEYPITNLSHQEVYEAFINAGNSFLLTIIRGGPISSQPSNMAMEMGFVENEYISASSQEFNTSEKIIATKVFEQQTVEEQTDNIMLNSQSEFGLDAIIAAVLSQGAASQDATESETFNDIYVNQDIEKQFDNLSFTLTEKVSNKEGHAPNPYFREELEAVEFKDNKSETYTMGKNLAGEQQLKAETDYQYSGQQLEAETTQIQTDYQCSRQQLEAETTETKPDYQNSEQKLEAETTQTKTDYQCSGKQLEAEATETKTDYQHSEQKLEAETTEIKADHQYSEQQLESKTSETKADYQHSEQKLKAETAETKTDYQHSEQQIKVETAETKTDYQHSKQQIKVETVETKTDYQHSKQQLETETSKTKTDNQHRKQQLETETAETKPDNQHSKQQLKTETAETKTDNQQSEQQLETETAETKIDYQPSEQQIKAETAGTKTDYQHSEQQLETETVETKTDNQHSEQKLKAETVETKTDNQHSEQKLKAKTAETKTDNQRSEQNLEAEATETKTDYQHREQKLEVETTKIKTDYQCSEQQLEAEAEAIETKVTAEEKPPIENVMGDTGVKKQHSGKQLKHNIKKNQQFLPLVAYPRPVLEAGGIKLAIPKDIYDDEFIAETLSGNAEIITGTTLGVNFHKYKRNYDYLRSSSVYQLIHEEENKS